MITRKIKNQWIRFWMKYAGMSSLGRIATSLATWFAPPFYNRRFLRNLNPQGYISSSAVISHADLRLGLHVFIDDRVVIFQADGGGIVEIGSNVRIYRDTIIQNGAGGIIKIADNTVIHPRCQFSAYLAPIEIRCGVQIAPNCAFYPYNHSFLPNEPINNQPLRTKGGILIDENAWLGIGVIVLDGVRIGKGAVIGAGAVVTHDIPDGSIAVGVPARVVKMRADIAINNSESRNSGIIS